MWATISTWITALLPYAIKMVLYLIEKKKDSDEIKEEMLKFIASVEKDLPIKLHDRHLEQIERIKKRLAEQREE